MTFLHYSYHYYNCGVDIFWIRAYDEFFKFQCAPTLQPNASVVENSNVSTLKSGHIDEYDGMKATIKTRRKALIRKLEMFLQFEGESDESTGEATDEQSYESVSKKLRILDDLIEFLDETHSLLSLTMKYEESREDPEVQQNHEKRTSECTRCTIL